MKSQNYVIAAILLLFISSVTYGQKFFDPTPVISFPVKVKSFGRTGASPSCDTLNYTKGQKWSFAYYQVYKDGSGGYVTGNNIYNDKQKAAFFNASSTNDNYLSRVWIAVYKANSQVKSHLDKIISVNIYDGSNGTPSRLLATQDLKLNDFKIAATDKVFLEVSFAPIALPASKKFFVSVDFSTLSWPSDSLCLFSNVSGESTENAWEQTSNGTWESLSTGWGSSLKDVSFHIYPFVSNATNGCVGSLPLKLLSFSSEKKNGHVILNWNVAAEYDMWGYEVERSADNIHFQPVYSIKATNTASVHTYSFTDKNASVVSSNTLFYRLKQINADGTATYSNILAVSINNKTITISFQNPFRNSLNINIESPTSQKALIRLYDIMGRYTGITKEVNLSAGITSVTVRPSAFLASGTYIADIVVNNKHYQYKIVKN